MSASTFQSSAAWRAPAVLVPLAVIGLIVTAGTWLSVSELAVLREARVVGDAPQALPRSAVPAESPGPRIDAARLSASRLFGVIDETQAATAIGAAGETGSGSWRLGDTVPDELPAAAESVTVQGIVFEPGSGTGRVLLGGAGSSPRSYRVDDELPGGAIIRHIEVRRIVVEEGGELKALTLPTPHGGAPLVRNLPKPIEFDTQAMQGELAADEEQAAYEGDADYAEDAADMDADLDMGGGILDDEAEDMQWNEPDYE